MPTTTITVRLPVELLERLEEYAARAGITRNEAVRRAIRLLLGLGDDAPEPRYRCPVCGRTFTLAALRRHILTHVETGRGYQCPVCGATFTRLAHLAQHAYMVGSKKGDRLHLQLWAALPSEKKRHLRRLARHILEQLASHEATKDDGEEKETTQH